MWIEIQGELINLDNINKIIKANKKGAYSIRLFSSGFAHNFEYATKQERNEALALLKEKIASEKIESQKPDEID